MISRRILWGLLVLLLASCRGGEGSTRRQDGLVPARDGVVLDGRTGLEWTSRDHDRALPWDEADRHCLELTAGGSSGWRLPEIEEVRALYDTRFNTPCGDRTCHLDAAIQLRDPYVWSASSRGPGTRFYFDFAFGNSLSPGIGPTLVRRVLCVRQSR